MAFNFICIAETVLSWLLDCVPLQAGKAFWRSDSPFFSCAASNLIICLQEVTEGLLGVWNGDRADDLTTEGGTVVSDASEFGGSCEYQAPTPTPTHAPSDSRIYTWMAVQPQY